MKRCGIIAVALVFIFLFGNKAIAKQEKGKIVVSIGDDFVNKKSEVKYSLQRRDTALIPLTQEHLRDYPPPRPGQRAILSPNGKLHYSSKYISTKRERLRSSDGGKKEISVLIVLIQPSDEDIPWEAEKATEYFQSSKDLKM